MGHREILEYLIANAFTLYVLARFTTLFFSEKRGNKVIKTVSYIMVYIMNCTAYLLFYSPIINICTSLLIIYVFTLYYKASMSRRVVATILVYTTGMACDITVAMLSRRYVVGMTIGVINNFLASLLILIIQLLIQHKVQLKYDFDIFKGHFIGILIVPFSSMVIICLLVYEKVNKWETTFAVAVLLLLLNIGVFYLYDSVLQTYKEKYRSFVLEQQISAYRNQMETKMHSQKLINGIKHDIKHHLSALESMLVANSDNECKSYLNEMIAAIENPREYSNTGNKDIDSILNYFIQKSEDKGFKVSSSVKIAEELGIKFFDLNVILCNLLENAVTATEKSAEKMLSIKIELDRNILYINIVNSYDGKIKEQNKQFQTTKPDYKNHGYGLENVEAIVEKHHGSLNIKYDEKKFVVEVVLFLDEL